MNFFEKVYELVKVDHRKVLRNVLGIVAYDLFFEICTIDVNGYVAWSPVVVSCTQLVWIEWECFRCIRNFMRVKRWPFLKAPKRTIITQLYLFPLNYLRNLYFLINLTNFFDAFDYYFFHFYAFLILISKDHRLHRYHFEINLTMIVILVK